MRSPFAFQNEQHFLVLVKVIRRAARGNRTNKLRHLSVNQHTVPAITGRHRALITEFYNRLFQGLSFNVSPLGRRLRTDEKDRICSPVLNAKGLLRANKNTGLGFQIVSNCINNESATIQREQYFVQLLVP